MTTWLHRHHDELQAIRTAATPAAARERLRGWLHEYYAARDFSPIEALPADCLSQFSEV